MDREKVINQVEVDIQRAERTGEMLVCVGRKTAKDVLALLKEQEQMYYTLEHDWRMCRELLKEQQERIETLESLRRIEQEGR